MFDLPAPFSENQLKYFTSTFHSWLNVAEGGKRGGKNVLNTYAFAANLEIHPNKLHLVAAVSLANAKLNVFDCDGYGLLNYFKGRCREGEYKNRHALYVGTPMGEKIILASGGGKDGDEKYIKGNSYGTAYITEANECHVKFIQEVFDRTIASKNRKIFHDLNPKGEGHFYYTDILNFHEEMQKKDPNYGYNYGHFTLLDNLSLSQNQIDAVIKTYDKKSIWFLRDILGQRRQTEGLVYPMFNKDFHVVPTEPRPYEAYWISNDFGVQHPCIFQLWGLANGVYYMVDEYYHAGQDKGSDQKTNGEYLDDLIKFAHGRKIKLMYRDNAPIASSFNVLLMRKQIFNTTSANNDVLPGIQEVSTALKQGLIKINDCCKNAIKEFGIYSWDSKAAEDEPIAENDDSMAALRYFVKSSRIAVPKMAKIPGVIY